MNTEDLRRLAERAEGIQGRQTDRLTELHGRIRTARRRRAAVGASVAAGLAIALVAGGAALTGTIDRTREPVDENTPRPTPRPTPTQTVETPRGQVTIQPEIGPGDIRGWELAASRTNAQPGFAGDTDLFLTAETGGLNDFQSHIVTFCNGDPDTWWVLTIDNLDGPRDMYGTCSKDDPTAVPGPTDNIEPFTGNYREGAMATAVRMFVVGELSPAVLRGPGIQSQALTMADGVEYLVDRAVLAAAGASRLVVQLPASDRPRIVAVHAEFATFEECAEQLNLQKPSNAAEEQANFGKMHRRCFVGVELRVDGRRPPNQEYSFYFGQQQVVLAPGEAREVTVEVVKGHPRNIRYALVIREARS